MNERMPKVVLTGVLVGVAAIVLLRGHEPAGAEGRVRPVAGRTVVELEPGARIELRRKGGGAGASCCADGQSHEAGSGAGSTCAH